MSIDWKIDELAHAGDEHLDPAFVAAYDAKQQTDPTEDVETLLALGVDGTATVVDLGSGTGTFALAIAPHVRRVVAADVSPAMVSYLRQRVTGAGLDNVTVVQAGFMSYRHDGPPAGVVHTRNALHQIPDFHKGIALAPVRSYAWWELYPENGQQTVDLTVNLGDTIVGQVYHTGYGTGEYALCVTPAGSTATCVDKEVTWGTKYTVSGAETECIYERTENAEKEYPQLADLGTFEFVNCQSQYADQDWISMNDLTDDYLTMYATYTTGCVPSGAEIAVPDTSNWTVTWKGSGDVVAAC